MAARSLARLSLGLRSALSGAAWHRYRRSDMGRAVVSALRGCSRDSARSRTSGEGVGFSGPLVGGGHEGGGDGGRRRVERSGPLSLAVERCRAAAPPRSRGAPRGAAGWWSETSLPFYSAYGRASAHTRALSSRTTLRADVSYEFASARAPLALWAGAGTSVTRPALLRAHPLLRDGVIEGPAFGRQLLGGSVEADHPLGALGPVAIRGALFVDAARVLAPRGTSLVDVGAGVRIQPTGWRSALRVDLATPWDRLSPELSVGWQTEWRRRPRGNRLSLQRRGL
jgi:hypothetical protein